MSITRIAATAALVAFLVTGLTACATAQPAPPAPTAQPAPAKPLSSGEVLAASTADDWRALPPEWTLVMEIAGGPPVVIELAPRFAPAHAESIRRLTRAGYYDGLAIIRVHDNYVTQWGDPAEDEASSKPKPADLPKVPAEFDRTLEGVPLTKLPDLDPWAALTGFADGFPVAADPTRGRAWLTHCYSMVGAGRGEAVDSSDGSSLYAVIGQPARGLDLNITSVGRVVQGIERLAGLPRGTGPLGFYAEPSQRVAIARVRMLADVPEAERPRLQVLRTDTATWEKWLNARRHRSGWFVHDHGRVDLCNVLPPVRTAP